jgi:hypothetical protein
VLHRSRGKLTGKRVKVDLTAMPVNSIQLNLC